MNADIPHCDHCNELHQKIVRLQDELEWQETYRLRRERYALLDLLRPRTEAEEARLAELDRLCEERMPPHYREREDYQAMQLLRRAADLIRAQQRKTHAD